MRILTGFFLFCMLFQIHAGNGEAPGPVDADDWKARIENGKLLISVQVSPSHYLYASNSHPVFQGKAPRLLQAPSAIPHRDPFSGENTDAYQGPGKFTWIYELDSQAPTPVPGAQWSECRDATDSQPAACLMPQTLERIPLVSDVSSETASSALFPDPDSARSAPVPASENTGNENGNTRGKGDEHGEKSFSLPRYLLLRQAAGYLNAEEFLGFLRDDESAFRTISFAGRGLLATALLALLGGLALNLTPCVLPLIPVNLAIIGAGGKSAGGRLDRILRGICYGLGIALTYGILGVAAVVTGTAFGQINATWYFNGLVAIVFLFLGLAMFDVFQLDFSRYDSRIRMPSSAHYWGVFLLGALSAVLAGACVAPVLAAALIQASTLYSGGNYAGLFLPFLLGVGMALPWPFAAAGITLFPKPGAWMMHVKHLLGMLILLLALYYGYTGGKILFSPSGAGNLLENGEKSPTAETAVHSSADAENPEEPAPLRLLREALEESAQSGKAVFIDFWATWCKNCIAMEKSTFRNPEVRKELEGFIVLKLQMENPDLPENVFFRKEFGFNGLPAYLILRGEKGNKEPSAEKKNEEDSEREGKTGTEIDPPSPAES